MGKSSIATLVSVQLANDITEMLDKRAKARGLSRSRFAALIFEKWRDEKYPPLDTVDGTARALVNQQILDEKSKAANPQKGSPARPIAKKTAVARAAHATMIQEKFGKPSPAKAPKPRAA